MVVTIERKLSYKIVMKQNYRNNVIGFVVSDNIRRSIIDLLTIEFL